MKRKHGRNYEIVADERGWAVIMNGVYHAVYPTYRLASEMAERHSVSKGTRPETPDSNIRQNIIGSARRAQRSHPLAGAVHTRIDMN